MQQDWLRAGVVAGFVGWLTIFPLSGGAGAADLLWFLVPHTLGLFLIARFFDHRLFHRARRVGAVGALIIGAVFVPLPPAAAPWVLALLGILTAPVSVQIGVVLRAAGRRTLTAAAGLAGGNLLALLVSLSSLEAALIFPLVSALLLTSLLLTGSGLRRNSDPMLVLRKFLPFIFFFQIVSGLMYGTLMPAYVALGQPPGLDLGAYATGALMAVWMFRRSQGLVLLAAVMAALTGYAFWLVLPESEGVFLAMLWVMLAAGAMDLFVLALVASLPSQLKAYGYGVGVLCAGIIAGRWVAMLTADHAGVISFFGLLILNVAVISLFIPWQTISSRTATLDRSAGHDAGASPDLEIDSEILARLSDRESAVLRLALTDMTYRDIAQSLQISESSVKTYMQRIFRKTGIVRRHQLDELTQSDSAEDR